jgi:hypothetical protein
MPLKENKEWLARYLRAADATDPQVDFAIVLALHGQELLSIPTLDWPDLFRSGQLPSTLKGVGLSPPPYSSGRNGPLDAWRAKALNALTTKPFH